MGKPELDPALLPVFQPGEALTIQRSVGGQNVLMAVEVVDPCSLSPRAMVLRAKMKAWGVSSYADGRVSRQAATIGRLMDERAKILELAIAAGATEIVNILVPEEEAETARPETLTNPDGSGYQV